MTNDEIYFACKKAFQEWDGKNFATLKQKLQEIFTPEVQAEMEQQERIIHAQQATEKALANAQSRAYQTGP